MSHSFYKVTMANRNKYWAAYHKERRRRRGLVSVTVEMRKRQRIWLQKLRRSSSYPQHEFYRRALLMGAAFVFNAGSTRAKKLRVKPPI